MQGTRDANANVRAQFDHQQNRALDAILDRCLASDDEFIFPIVDGPPGTGKTTVGTASVIELLREDPNTHVLYLCYTNFAAERAKESLRGYGLAENQVIRLTPNPNETNWQQGIVGSRFDFSDLSANDQRRLKSCPVLLCTLHGSRKASKTRRVGTRIIVDEFSQVDPAIFFATINRVRDCNPRGYALLGDPQQLPVITTQPLLRPNIATFVMRRKPYDPHRLVTQHRMHEHICAAVNSLRSALGTYPIQTGQEVRNRTLESLGYAWNRNPVPEQFREILDPNHLFVMINSDRLGGTEQRWFRGSVRNTTEARLAATLAQLLSSSYQKEGQPLRDIAILSPYAAQVAEISQALPQDLQGRSMTIYKAQGREYASVVISFVRSNPQGFIGFLDEAELKAQTYVACSRAKAKLIVILSFETFFGKGHRDFDYLNETQNTYRFDARL